MRPITRRAIVVLLAILLLLLALGALPGLLRSGDPYYLTAEPTDQTLEGNESIVDATNLSERTYRYTWAALRDAERADGNATGGVGRSEPYWRGPFGIKEAFTHSPFDEMDALRTRYPWTVVAEDAAFVRRGNQTYRLALTGG